MKPPEIALTAAVATLPSPLDRRMQAVVLGVLASCGVGYLVWGLSATMIVVAPGLINSLDLPAGADFIAFYAAGVLAQAGEAAAAYDPARHLAAEQALLAVEAPKLPFAYPPPFLLLLRFFAAVPPEAALWLWLALGVAAALALGRVLLGRWALAPLAIAFPGIGHSLICSQTGTLVALAAGIAFRFWSTSPVLAGVALGMLALKPHFAVFPALLALFERRWALLGAAAATGAALLLASLAIDGTAPWFAFAEAAPRMARHVAEGTLPIGRMVSAFAVMRLLTGDAALAALVHGAVAAGAFACGIALWRRTRDPLARALTFATATVLVTPYAYDYDLALLAIPAATLFARPVADWAPVDTRFLTAFAALPVIAYASGAAFQVQPASLALIGLLGAAALRGMGPLRTPG